MVVVRRVGEGGGGGGEEVGGGGGGARVIVRQDICFVIVHFLLLPCLCRVVL